MKAKIKVETYKCAPNGHTVETYRKGDIVEGATAKFALDDNAAAKISAKSKSETKDSGAAPENK